MPTRERWFLNQFSAVALSNVAFSTSLTHSGLLDRHSQLNVRQYDRVHARPGQNGLPIRPRPKTLMRREA